MGIKNFYVWMIFLLFFSSCAPTPETPVPSLDHQDNVVPASEGYKFITPNQDSERCNAGDLIYIYDTSEDGGTKKIHYVIVRNFDQDAEYLEMDAEELRFADRVKNMIAGDVDKIAVNFYLDNYYKWWFVEEWEEEYDYADYRRQQVFDCNTRQLLFFKPTCLIEDYTFIYDITDEITFCHLFDITWATQIEYGSKGPEVSLEYIKNKIIEYQEIIQRNKMSTDNAQGYNPYYYEYIKNSIDSNICPEGKKMNSKPVPGSSFEKEKFYTCEESRSLFEKYIYADESQVGGGMPSSP